MGILQSGILGICRASVPLEARITWRTESQGNLRSHPLRCRLPLGCPRLVSWPHPEPMELV